MYIKIIIAYNNNEIPKKNNTNECSYEQVFGYIPNTWRGVEVYL